MNGEEWSCYLFPNFPDGITYDFGGPEFCGYNDNHFYPDCDPQVIIAIIKSCQDHWQTQSVQCWDFHKQRNG